MLPQNIYLVIFEDHSGIIKLIEKDILKYMYILKSKTSTSNIN